MSTPKLENTLYAYFNKLSTSILMGGGIYPTFIVVDKILIECYSRHSFQ